MKFLCDGCSRLVELREFSLREGALVATCPECRHENRTAAPAGTSGVAGQAAAAPPERRPAAVLELARPKPPPEGPLCPKCGTPHSADLTACSRCGLVFALFNPENLALPKPLEEQWSALEGAWTEVERHEAFLADCSLAGVLTEAARRYRVRSEQVPGDALAIRYRDEAGAKLMALASLPLQREPKSEGASTRVKLVVAVLFFLASVGVCVAIFRQMFSSIQH
ncbi:MAG: hypothetical protein HY901_11500 [Deltaproteobacteria bacterium]|nr:hypothetical protein [Deltaproteobacteria bacterium]